MRTYLYCFPLPLSLSLSVADLDGGGGLWFPLWATHWRRHSRSCYLMLNFDRSSVKHGTHNIHNECHTSGFLAALECTKFFFGRGSAPDRTRGAYIASQTLYLLKGAPCFWGRGEGRGRDREGRPPIRKFLDAPLSIIFSLIYIRNFMRLACIYWRQLS